MKAERERGGCRADVSPPSKKHSANLLCILLNASASLCSHDLPPENHSSLFTPRPLRNLTCRAASLL